MDFKDLTAGWQNYKRNAFEKERALLEKLARGERDKPPMAVFGCVDPRLNFAHITSQVAGTITPKTELGGTILPYGSNALYVSAYLDFVLNGFKTEHLVVFGHSDCAFVKGLFGDKDTFSKLGPDCNVFASMAQETVGVVYRKIGHRFGPEDMNRAIEIHTLLQVQHLLTYPKVRDGVNAGKLHVYPMFYDIATSNLSLYDPREGNFKPLGQTQSAAPKHGVHVCGHDCLHIL